MEKLKKFVLLNICVFIGVSCSNDNADASCIVGPCGSIAANMANITVSVAKIENPVSNVTLVYEGQEVLLSTSGFDVPNTLTYSCWETIPGGKDVMRVKFTLEGTTYDMEVVNSADTEIVVLEIIKVNDSLAANLGDYVECDDNPSS